MTKRFCDKCNGPDASPDNYYEGYPFRISWTAPKWRFKPGSSYYYDLCLPCMVGEAQKVLDHFKEISSAQKALGM